MLNTKVGRMICYSWKFEFWMTSTFIFSIQQPWEVLFDVLNHGVRPPLNLETLGQ